MSKNIIFVLTDEINPLSGEVKILPMGYVTSTKGDFIVDEESVELMHKAFVAHGVDIVIDYEHQTLEGTKAPAGGWIKDFHIKNGAVVAKVEWTAEAKKYIDNKEYRYLSPVVLVRDKDKKVIELLSVALTNTPAIDSMYAIVNSNKIINSGRTDNGMELFAQLRELLGLPDEATGEEIIEALKEILAQANSDDDKQEDGAEEEAAGDIENDTAEDESGMEEDEEDEEKALKAQFYALKKKIAAKEANELVTHALKQGKITLAQKPWAKQYALTNPKGFNNYLKNAPAVVPVGELTTPKKLNASQLSETEIKVCKALGLSKDDIKNHGKDVDEWN